jgi:hypothetical protein
MRAVQQPLLVFVHILKTAGTTLEMLLLHHYGDDQAGPEVEPELDLIGRARVVRRDRVGLAKEASRLRSLPLATRVELALKERELANERAQTRKAAPPCYAAARTHLEAAGTLGRCSGLLSRRVILGVALLSLSLNRRRVRLAKPPIQ